MATKSALPAETMTIRFIEDGWDRFDRLPVGAYFRWDYEEPGSVRVKTDPLACVNLRQGSATFCSHVPDVDARGRCVIFRAVVATKRDPLAWCPKCKARRTIEACCDFERARREPRSC